MYGVNGIHIQNESTTAVAISSHHIYLGFDNATIGVQESTPLANSVQFSFEFL